MTRFQILKEDVATTIDPNGLLRNIFDRLEILEQQMGSHLNSMASVQFKRGGPLLSEQLNQIVQPHRIDDPLPDDRVTIPEDMKPYA